MTATTPYRSAWCTQADHDRCKRQYAAHYPGRCTCDCHGIDAIVAPTLAPDREPGPVVDAFHLEPAPAPRTAPQTRAERRKDAATYAGYREARFARSTGTLVVLLGDAVMDGDTDNPYATFCDDHGEFVVHATRPLARQFMSAPEEWCQTCQTNTKETH